MITGKTRRGAKNASVYAAKPGGKKATGAPSEYDAMRYPAIARKMCALGATMAELAQAFGKDEDTIGRWMKAHEEFCGAINKGKDEFDSGRIKTAMRDRALGYNWTEVSEETVEIKADKLVKDNSGQYTVARDAKGKPVTVMVPAVKRKVTNKHVPAEPVCMFFWLTNRQRKDWQHIRVNKVEGKLDGPSAVTNNFFDLKQVDDRELEQIENFIAKARADKRDEAGTGPRGTA